MSCASRESKETVILPIPETRLSISISNEPQYDIRFHAEQYYSFDDGINWLTNLSVDSSDRIYFADGREMGGSRTVQIYHPDGTYCGELGGVGRGPGEFQSMDQIKIMGDRLYVYDFLLMRFTIFSLESLLPVHITLMQSDQWNHLEEIRNSQPARRKFFPLGDENFLVGFSDRFPVGSSADTAFVRYFHIDSNGDISSNRVFKQVDTGFPEGDHISPPPPPGSTSRPMNLPFTRSSLMAVSKDGSIYSAWTEELLIRIHSSDGKYEGSLYYPYQNSPLDEEDLEELQNYYRNIGRELEQQAREVDIPDTWPALDQMLVDDENRLWVSTIIDDDELYEWWVLNASGKLLARFNWPGNKHNRHGRRNHMIMQIKNGYLYAFESGEEILWDDRIVRYRIELEER